MLEVARKECLSGQAAGAPCLAELQELIRAVSGAPERTHNLFKVLTLSPGTETLGEIGEYIGYTSGPR